MPGILSEGSREEPVPMCGAPRRIRSAPPYAWDRLQWRAMSRWSPGTECCRRRPYSEGQWNQMWQQVQGAGRGADLARSYSQVLGGGSQAAMTKQQLNGPDVGARLE